MEKSQSYFFFGFLVVIGILAVFIALPYLPAIVFAGALAVVMRPLFKFFERRTKSNRLGAWLTLIAATILVFIPLSFIGFRVVHEAGSLYGHLSAQGFSGLPAGDILKNLLGKISPNLSTDSEQITQKVLSWMLSNASLFFGHLVTVLFNVFICFIALYYFLAEGAKAKDWFLLLSPLPKHYDEMIFERLSSTVTSVLRGTLVIASIQGLIAGVGFLVFGIPNPALWGSAAAVSALIPGVGTSLVLIPAIIYALVFSSLPKAIGLAVWAFAAIGLIDNILGPRLMRRGAKIHPFLIFISVLGGLAVFGPLGFIVGPLVFSLLFTLLDIYASTRALQ